MGVETLVNYVADLDQTLPGDADKEFQGAEHLRNVKKALKQTFPNISGAVTLTHTELNLLDPANLATLGANVFTAQQTFVGVKDTVYAITDGAAFAITPENGSIQTITLGANRTPAATGFAAGHCVLLGIDDGAAYSVTWTTVAVTWVKVSGTASAPTLATSGYTWVLLWKVGSTIYGCEVGKP
jgi:hypothetical protein